MKVKSPEIEGRQTQIATLSHRAARSGFALCPPHGYFIGPNTPREAWPGRVRFTTAEKKNSRGTCLAEPTFLRVSMRPLDANGWRRSFGKKALRAPSARSRLPLTPHRTNDVVGRRCAGLGGPMIHS